MENNILYIPIKINGGGDTAPTNLLERELYVLDNGTLYVGKNNGGTIEVGTVIGNVVPNAAIVSPKIETSLFVGDDLVKDSVPTTGEHGQVVFIRDNS